MDIKSVAKEIKRLEREKNQVAARKQQVSQELELQQFRDIEESSPVGIRKQGSSAESYAGLKADSCRREGEQVMSPKKAGTELDSDE